MNIVELIQKFLAGQELSDAEKTALKSYKPEDTAALKAQIEELTKKAASAEESKLTETEKLSQKIANLTAQFEASQKAAQEANAKAAQMQRQQSIAAIRQKHGIQFVGGVSPQLLDAAFAGAFEGLEDLNDETKISEAVTAFKSANAALILDTSGSGAGGQPKGTAPSINGKSAELAGGDDVRAALQASGVLKK